MYTRCAKGDRSLCAIGALAGVPVLHGLALEEMKDAACGGGVVRLEA